MNQGEVGRGKKPECWQPGECVPMPVLVPPAQTPLPASSAPCLCGFFPGYLGSTLLVGGVVLTGFGVEAVGGGGQLVPPQWPVNAMFLTFFMGWIVLLSRMSGAFAAWLGSVPFALASMLAVGVLGAIGGTVPQGAGAAPAWARPLGLDHVFSGIPFAIALLLFLTNLGIAICRRIRSQGWKAWFFSLNHLGIWITVASALFGAGDMIRARMILFEGRAEAMIVDTRGRAGYLPFGLFLQRFYVEQYGEASGRPGAPKRFSADVTVLTRTKSFPNAVIEVNRPLRRDGWTLYLTNYELSPNGQTDQCLIEAVRDPWLPGVYLGIFLMLGGAVAMLFKCPFANPGRTAANISFSKPYSPQPAGRRLFS